MFSGHQYLIILRNSAITIWSNKNQYLKKASMKTIYRITSKEVGDVLLKKRKIAKAYRWWLRENGYTYNSTFFFR